MQCPHCHQEHSDDTLFCPLTGQKIVRPALCPHCGQPVDPAWLHCGHCGQRLNPGETTSNSYGAPPTAVSQAPVTAPVLSPIKNNPSRSVLPWVLGGLGVLLGLGAIAAVVVGIGLMINASQPGTTLGVVGLLPTATPTPTPGCVMDWTGTFPADQGVCLYDPQWITVTGSVSLTPANSVAYLQTDWYAVEPDDGSCPSRSKPCTSDHYATRGIVGSTSFAVKAWWPGIRSSDSSVEVHVGANVLNCETTTIHGGIGSNLYWDPSICPAPTPAP